MELACPPLAQDKAILANGLELLPMEIAHAQPLVINLPQEQIAVPTIAHLLLNLANGQKLIQPLELEDAIAKLHHKIAVFGQEIAIA